jgi:DNA modification methylase
MPNNFSAQGEPSLIATAPGKIADPSIYQLELLPRPVAVRPVAPYSARLAELLAADLDFHGYDTGYASHDFHAFPAKFPPQLPRTFIRTLTTPGDTVLDPMMGSGTTVVEGYLAGCTAIGVDIDPLAALITKVKTTPIDPETLTTVSRQIVKSAAEKFGRAYDALVSRLETRWDAKTTEFIEYWFAKETQAELLALIEEIENIEDERIRDFFLLVLSACIITKSGGVSLAFDLAHTRPHKAKIAFAPSGALVTGEELLGDASPRVKLLTKNVRSAIVEFRKRGQQNINSLNELPQAIPARIHLADAQRLPVEDGSVDLIVTSPPYAVNAIDYMRANKFALTWLGYSLDQLAETRKNCIGGEGITALPLEALPPYTGRVVDDVTRLDPKRGQSLHRYYSEMTRILREMHRVLKPDRAAVVVVASSVIRDRDTETDKCLAEIGEAIGFDAPHIGIRRLDRNRRMMPAGQKIDGNSQIQKRMHEEFVIGFYKPQ